MGAKSRRLTPHKSRVQTSRHSGVSCALDDGAAVGEERHFVGVAPEFQDEIIVADNAMRFETAVQFGEVDRTLALMDLHGIPAAQRDVGAALSSEMNEVPFAAGAAVGPGFRGGNFYVLVAPNIE